MPENVIGLIPAAGKGVRLGLPYPKELYPVIRNNQYKPVAQYVVENLTLAGVQHVVLVVNDTKNQLMGYFGNGQRFGCNISYVVQEQRNGDSASTDAGAIHGPSSSPGLAHALDSAYHLVRGNTVYFGMADTIMQPESVFARACNEARADDDVILALFATTRPEKFGMVRMDTDGRVCEIVDKPANTDLTHMWGCIIWRSRFTEHLHQAVCSGVSDFAYIMNSALEAGMRFRGVRMDGGVYVDLGTYEEIAAMDQALLRSE